MAERPGALSETATVDVHGLSSTGDGVSRLSDGRTVFVPWTLPGDRVRVRVVESRKRFARAVPVEILEGGPGRVTPTCPHYGVCGGCRLQHVSGTEQLRWKGRFVEEALKRIGGLEAVGEVPVAPAPAPFHYRGRVTFTVAHRGGRVRAGLREAGRPGRVAEVEVCHLADPRIQETWTALRRSLQEPGLIPPGAVLRVTLRVVQEGVLLMFAPRCPGREGEAFAGLPHVIQVWESTDKGPRRLWGEVDGHETWFGRAVAVPAASFTQVNLQAGQHLLDAVVEAAGDVSGLKVVDALRRPVPQRWGVGRAGGRPSLPSNWMPPRRPP